MKKLTTMLADPAFILRVGAGLLFIVGGWNKLSQLLNPGKVDAILASYNGTAGYINQFFQEFLFQDYAWLGLTQFSFLTTLSAFELISGILLILGIWVRPLALLYSLLLWTFVVALPVMTVPGVSLDGVKTYYSPAILVQIRDISLSFMFMALLILGTGKYSVWPLFDKKFKNSYQVKLGSLADDTVKFLLRFGLALTFLVGGLFAGMDSIKTFGPANLPFMLLSLMVALTLISGHLVRVAAGVAGFMMLYYVFTKLNLDKSLLANLNSVKREFALLAMAYVLIRFDGGNLLRAEMLGKKHFWQT